MSNFVLGALIVQVLGGVYLFSYAKDAGTPSSNARGTRLPGPVLLAHPPFGLAALVVWIAHLNTDAEALPWVALGLLAVGGAIGTFLGVRTLRPAPDPVRASPEDPAAARLAEKRIPKVAIAAHGGLALVILVCVLLVALGVG